MKLLCPIQSTGNKIKQLTMTVVYCHRKTLAKLDFVFEKFFKLFSFPIQESIQTYPQLIDEITIPWLDIEPFVLPFKGFNETVYPKVIVLALFGVCIKVLTD